MNFKVAANGVGKFVKGEIINLEKVAQAHGDGAPAILDRWKSLGVIVPHTEADVAADAVKIAQAAAPAGDVAKVAEAVKQVSGAVDEISQKVDTVHSFVAQYGNTFPPLQELLPILTAFGPRLDELDQRLKTVEGVVSSLAPGTAGSAS